MLPRLNKRNGDFGDDPSIVICAVIYFSQNKLKYFLEKSFNRRKAKVNL